MTTIDQAFIRAYLQQTAQAVPQRDVAPPAEPANEPEPPTAAHEQVSVAVIEPPAVEPPAPTPVVEAPAPTAIENGPAGDGPVDADFAPMLQVDGFAWSERATSLRLAAGIQVDRLADGLAAGIDERRNVIAIAGCRRHQGCTTSLLCVAKRLADRGLNVAILDGDFAHPAMGAQLGLLPEAGLEAVLAGRLPLDEVAIESLGDKMTVLPLAAPCAEQADSPEGVAILSAVTAVLRQHYDLVLVDMGDLGHQSPAVSRCVDAVVLVHDVRSTPQAEVEEAARQLEAEGIVHLGLVENFA